MWSSGANHDGTYVATTGDNIRFIGASQFFLAAGSPSSGLVGRAPCWLLDAAADEAVAGSFTPPAWWVTYDLFIWWSNAGAGSGNVDWWMDRVVAGDGESLAGSATETALGALAAPAQNVIEVTAGPTGVTVGTRKLHTYRIYRQGAQGGDTLANDVGFLGVEIRRAS